MRIYLFPGLDVDLKRDLELVSEALKAISLEMSDLSAQFEQELSTNQNLEAIARQLVDTVVLNHDIENTDVPSVSTSLRVDPIAQLGISRLFTSGVGVEIVSQCVQQFASTRFALLRDLYLFQTTALQLCNQANIGPNVIQAIQNELQPYTASLLRAYQVLKEMNIRQLSYLNVSDTTALANVPIGPALFQKIDQRGVSLLELFIFIVGYDQKGASLLELFIVGCGGEKMRGSQSMANYLSEDPAATWSVIRQFEEYSAPDVVISLARNAIAIADDIDENLLGHNSEAYSAMMENPDPTRRKDCLRQLLICLCERGDLQALVDFPYTDLEEEVENILESRARCMDLTSYNYYDLLYAFHIFRNNYRKGGSVMYEHGMRLGREVPGRQGLQRQAQCYLAALNALRLVKPEYSWIIKPTIPTRPSVSGSRFEIVEIADIEREYMLVDARLRLLSQEEDSSLAAASCQGADEIVGLLVKAGMYDRAVIVSRAFTLPLNPVFESLALRCVNLAKNSTYHMRGDNDYTSQAWSWLKTNNLTLKHVSKESSSSDEAWQLLQQYLSRYEDQSGRYHRCTATKLLAHGFALPTWLINSYKGLNSAELLRLYIDHDLLEEATSLCTEYLDAVLDSFKGQDSELFSIKMYQGLKDRMTIYKGKLHSITEQVLSSTQQQQQFMQTGW
ncbi:NU160-like protein [Mya arenaria]|uniref:NU160-like protein n=1 Tax=Mya arenaria TaxID=6604 RepID=A0ABY7DUS2_MYAAR|nr:NU160-like protein [Mya arenaria]